jgi:AhpD family alkylhydroperoxidase
VPRIDPIPRSDLARFEDRFALAEDAMGFVPNSLFTMARVPGLFETFSDLAGVVLRNELVPRPLVQMVALVASTASGCRYCQAHTAHTAERVGVSADKLADIWSYETSDHFDDAERAALRIAQAGGSTPNEATDEMFDVARQFFDDDQLAAIVAVIALFGYLNRWNDTVATQLEDMPTAFGRRVLASGGWEVGKHA